MHENNRVKIKENQRQSTKVTHKQFRWCCFSSVFKGYHIILLI